MNIYVKCPQLENDDFLIRQLDWQDINDLLSVYSDEKAVPNFNSDNCDGDDFYYDTFEKMKNAIDFWFYSYSQKYFVRWSIVEKKSDKVIGTIEYFKRESVDDFNESGVLRLDLGSKHETAEYISNIISLFVPNAFEMLDCDRIITKAVSPERIAALEDFGFTKTDNPVIGSNGVEYFSYYVIEKE